MALSLSGQNIISDVGDSGTYSWADIVALGSTNLTSHTTTSGRTLYRWAGKITLRGTCTLNIYSIDLELLGTSTTLPGQIVVQDSAICNFGRKRTVSGNSFYDKGCQIKVTRTFHATGGSGNTEILYSPLSCVTGSTNQINIYNSSLFVSDVNNITTATKRVFFLFYNLENSIVESENISGSVLCQIRTGGTFLNTNFIGGNVELLGGLTTVTFSGCKLYDNRIGCYVDATITRNTIVGLSQFLDTRTPGFSGSSNGIDFINSPGIDISTFRIIRTDTGAVTVQEHRKLYRRYLRIVSGGVAVQDALVTYTGRTNTSATSDASGDLTVFELVAQETNIASQTKPALYGDYPTPTPLVNYSSYTEEIRSYAHVPYSSAITVSNALGESGSPFLVSLVVDSGVSQSNTTTVGAYTGVSHTSTATTVSGTRTLAEVYDSRKLYWRTNGGLYPSLVGVVADWDTIDLVISGTLSGVTKFRDGIKTSSGDITIASPSALTTNLETVSGTVTLQSAGDYSGIVGTIGASATVVVANGSTNLEGWVGNGSTINVSSGSATVTVDDTGDWVAGSGVTLQQPQVFLVAANFADGTRVQVAHRQVFTVSASDVNTTTNAIALGNDSNGDAPAFDTSPRTLVRFSKPSGSTLPVSSPQIRGNGLYFASLSGSSLTLSITDGGSAIDFSTQGSGTFELIAETELDNSVVSGGSGYSHTLSLSNGALARVKAIHWSESGGDASCSIFYDQIFAWSSVAGITIIDTIDNTVEVSQDAIHERLVAIPSITLAAEIEDATGAISDTYSLTSDGSTVTGLSLALEGRGKVQVNSDDTDGILLWQTLYLWGKYICSTESGIRLASSTSFVAKDIFTYSFLYLEFDNTSTTQLLVVGGIGMSADGSNPIAATSNSIILNAVSQGNGAIVPVGSGLSTAQDTKLTAIFDKTETLENGLTTAQEAKVDQIKTKVDSLTNGLTSEQLTTLNEIQTQVDSLENGLTASQLTLVTAIKTQVDSLYNGLTTEQATTLGTIQTAVAALYNGLTPTQVTSLSTIQTAVASLYNGLTPSQGTQLSAIETKVNTLENGLTSSQATQLAAVKTQVDTLYNGLTPDQVTQVTAIKTKVDTLENGLTTAQADQVDDMEAAITAIQILETERNKAIGLISGVSASQQDPTEDEPGFLTTSDDAIDITLTLVDGVITATRN